MDQARRKFALCSTWKFQHEERKYVASGLRWGISSLNWPPSLLDGRNPTSQERGPLATSSANAALSVTHMCTTILSAVQEVLDASFPLPVSSSFSSKIGKSKAALYSWCTNLGLQICTFCDKWNYEHTCGDPSGARWKFLVSHLHFASNANGNFSDEPRFGERPPPHLPRQNPEGLVSAFP